jgi:hypothetical protein
MTTLTRGTIRSYDAASHRASVQVAGSLAVWVDGVAVASAIPAGDVVVGRECAVLFFTDDNPDDAVVLALHGAAPGPGGWRRVIDADGDTYVHTELSTDEDRVRTVIAGVLRTLVQGTSPEFQVTGDAQVSGGLGLRGTAPSASTGINADWTAIGVATPDLVRGILRAVDATTGARGVTGEVQVPAANANAMSYARGLEFRANHSGAGTVTDLAGAQASVEGTGPATNRMAGFFQASKLVPTATLQAGVRSRLAHTGSGTMPSYDAYRSDGLMLNATVTEFAHFHLTDITLGSGAVITNHYGFWNPGITFGTNRRPFWDAGIGGSPSDAAGNRFRANTAFGTVATANLFGAGDGVIHIANAPLAPSANPAGGGILYASAGALIWRGSAGTITTIAPA